MDNLLNTNYYNIESIPENADIAINTPINPRRIEEVTLPEWINVLCIKSNCISTLRQLLSKTKIRRLELHHGMREPPPIEPFDFPPDCHIEKVENRGPFPLANRLHLPASVVSLHLRGCSNIHICSPVRKIMLEHCAGITFEHPSAITKLQVENSPRMPLYQYDFAALKSFTMEEFDITPSMIPLQLGKNLTALTLKFCTVREPHLERVFGALTGLEKLNLWCVKFRGKAAEAADNVFPPLPALKVLKLCPSARDAKPHIFYNISARLIRSACVAPVQLTKLELTIKHSEATPELIALIEKLPHLEYLTLHTCVRQIRLTPPRGLKHLVLFAFDVEIVLQNCTRLELLKLTGDNINIDVMPASLLEVDIMSETNPVPAELPTGVKKLTIYHEEGAPVTIPYLLPSSLEEIHVNLVHIPRLPVLPNLKHWDISNSVIDSIDNNGDVFSSALTTLSSTNTIYPGRVLPPVPDTLHIFDIDASITHVTKWPTCVHMLKVYNDQLRTPLELLLRARVISILSKMGPQVIAVSPMVSELSRREMGVITDERMECLILQQKHSARVLTHAVGKFIKLWPYIRAKKWEVMNNCIKYAPGGVGYLDVVNHFEEIKHSRQ